MQWCSTAAGCEHLLQAGQAQLALSPLTLKLCQGFAGVKLLERRSQTKQKCSRTPTQSRTLQGWQAPAHTTP